MHSPLTKNGKPPKSRETWLEMAATFACDFPLATLIQSGQGRREDRFHCKKTTMKASQSLSRIRMPAEWERHAACLILFPHNAATFRLSLAQPQVLRVARTIATVGQEPVILFANDEMETFRLRELLKLDENIRVLTCPSNDTWARDTAPTFVTLNDGDGQNNELLLRGLDWDFNAYGGAEEGCYWPCCLDQKVAATMCRQISDVGILAEPIESLPISLVLEGGSIHTDGEGTILTTRECLLNNNRNPSMSRQEIEEIILCNTGCTKMIWLSDGLANDDDTNGHVDNFACFIRPGHVLLAWTDDEVYDTENYVRCRAALQILQKERDARERNLTVDKLYLPTPMTYSQEVVDSLNSCISGPSIAARHAGERLAASYINFYIANGAVIVPQFDDDVYDSKAIETLEELFPAHKVVGVSSKEILIGGGNIHCITQQVPSLL
jgi:agmatine deiminase